MRRLTKREIAEREFGRAIDKEYARAIAQAQRMLQPYLEAETRKEHRAGIPYDDIVRGLKPPRVMSDEELEQTVFRKYSPWYAGELERRARTKRRIEHKRAYMKAYYSAKRKSLTT